jgi:prolyl 4-hydroxylase
MLWCHFMNHYDELWRADELDRAGQHQEAIKALVSAVQKSDVEALVRLGKRLLVGDRAPRLPQDGANLLKEAAAKGSAEAPALLSVLYALGLYTKQGWHEGLESLALAANRGWVPAQKQLQVLADPGCIYPSAKEKLDWNMLALKVDLGAWSVPPAGSDLCASPLIRTFPDFALPGTCNWLIARSRKRLQRTSTFDASPQQLDAVHTRTNSSVFFDLMETDLVNVLLQVRMAACTGLPFSHLEVPAVLHYDVGQQISDHYDFIDPATPDYDEQISKVGQRIITFFVYLNDDYEAGETAFPRLGINYRGRRGEGLFLVNASKDGHADTRTLHAGRPVEQGTKWLVSQFIRNRPVLAS